MRIERKGVFLRVESPHWRLIQYYMKRLPAEWEPQRFVQLTWPHKATDWAPMLDEVNACFVELALAIVRFEPLLIVCANATAVRQLLHEGCEAMGIEETTYSQIRLVEMLTNDTWARDHGGITVMVDGQAVIYDYGFNGWGQKFEAGLDNQLTRKLYDAGAFNTKADEDGATPTYLDCNDFILEGGSLESDGNGTLLTTSECLLSEFRNPSYTREMIEHRLKSDFGLSRVLWLNHGYLEGDDTDSHIDTLARFCDRDTIAYVRCDDPVDAHYEALQKMEQELMQFRTFAGVPYRLIPLPMADAVYDEEGNRLPATYANFLIVNGAVLMPTYGSLFKDEMAQNQLQLAFPDREIVMVDCRILIEQHGSLHCVTMQY